jgi:hypothetical protein
MTKGRGSRYKQAGMVVSVQWSVQTCCQRSGTIEHTVNTKDIFLCHCAAELTAHSTRNIAAGKECSRRGQTIAEADAERGPHSRSQSEEAIHKPSKLQAEKKRQREKEKAMATKRTAPARCSAPLFIPLPRPAPPPTPETNTRHPILKPASPGPRVRSSRTNRVTLIGAPAPTRTVSVPYWSRAMRTGMAGSTIARC